MPLSPLQTRSQCFGRFIQIAPTTYKDWEARADRMPSLDAWRHLLYAETHDPAFSTEKNYQSVLAHTLTDGSTLYATPTDHANDPKTLRRLIQKAMAGGSPSPTTTQPTQPAEDRFIRKYNHRIQRF